MSKSSFLILSAFLIIGVTIGVIGSILWIYPVFDGGMWVWYFIRASGILGYILLFLLIVSGIGIKTGLIHRFFDPVTTWMVHKLIGLSMSVAIVVHIVLTLLDNHLKFTLGEVFIPFIAHYENLSVALGIIGFYFFLAILISSLFMISKTPKFWRFLHYFSYPTFVLLFLHGVFIGSDTNSYLMQIIYWSTGIIFWILTLYRLIKMDILRK